MKPETKQKIEEAGKATVDFLATHPVVRGLLIGLAIGFLAGAWAF